MKTIAAATALSLALLTASACDDGKKKSPTPQPTAACGNGQLNGVELCDGAAFARGEDCADYGLANGKVGCTAACRLDFSGCSYQDYCTANGLYGNGACDPCDALGGVRDPDCDVVCGADGVCADVYDPLVDAYTCRRVGKIDPDCGTCGNRILEGNELCDGTAWNPTTFSCEAYGFFGGTVACRSDCGPDFSRCVASTCGDGVIEGFEECEGRDLGGLSCADFDGVAGSLTCDTQCRIDASACIAPGCGNDVLEPATEACDTTQFGGETCVSRGYAGGPLVCTEGCAIDESECVPPGCQNGIKEEGEDCEYVLGVPELYGATCESEGFLPTPGAVVCDPVSCTYDTSTCVAAGCGNGVVESPVEECEGAGTQACAGLGFQSGTASCDACRWDRSTCVGGCGNGVIEGGEQCEGLNLNGQTCQSQGRGAGTLACGASCQFDLSGCGAAPVGCGNGILEPGELCDGTQFMQTFTCAGMGLGSGTVTCSNKCTPNFSGCTVGDLCAHLGYYDDPWCDPCEAWGGSPDPACASCVSDGTCVGYWDVLVGLKDTCVTTRGARDPDCLAVCGDGQIGGWSLGEDFLLAEPCDGASFAFTDANQCAAFGDFTGPVSCTNDCQLNFGACQ